VKYVLTRVSGPASDPVSLAEAKAHLRVDSIDDDAMIVSYLLAARRHIEDIASVAMRTQTFDMTLDQLPCGTVELPLLRYPLQSVTSITYIDSAGALQTWAAANYQVDATTIPGRVKPAPDATWPSARVQMAAATVRFVAGYADDACPDELRHAVLLLTAHFYENREPVNIGNIVNKIPFAVDALVAPFRLYC
jgi:uncharacterized phiE125 gp8 family phage protein